MDDADVLLAIIAVRSYLKKKKKRRFGVHPLNIVRLSHGQFHTIMGLLRNDEEKFFSYFRMSTPSFDELLSYIKSDITKKNTTFRLSVSAEERLAVTLR
ncbi:hypothetical protein NQ314_016852 [Rhamnusium bicolor]|uniref:Protein ANTAGONIST OF LIKE HETEROCHROMATIN PROTEIN 1-like n=1 Tax=Rhamnusium bicolor TaxID=1586634 RepID=A0AAV8WUU8_9CUCU|nr:hypothetical protein NQ314_016852 [Rhamnusium bicolor]